eukprot:1160218-Pelagomonas_calceolata.AAC.8
MSLPHQRIRGKLVWVRVGMELSCKLGRRLRVPLAELGFKTHEATKLALKLHALSSILVNLLARRALEQASINSHHQDQARGTAKNPPDPR